MNFLGKVVVGGVIGLTVVSLVKRVKRNKAQQESLQNMEKTVEFLRGFDAKACVEKALSGVQIDLANSNLEQAEGFAKKAEHCRNTAADYRKCGYSVMAASAEMQAERYQSIADSYYTAWYNAKGKNEQPIWTPSN